MLLKFNRFAPARAFRSPADFSRFATAQAEKLAELQKSAPTSWESWASQLSNSWRGAGGAATSVEPERAQQAVNETLRQAPVFLADGLLALRLKDMADHGRTNAARQIFPYLTGRFDDHNGGQIYIRDLDARAEFAAILAIESTTLRGKERVSIDEIVREHESRLDELLKADQAELTDQRERFDRTMLEIGEHFDEVKRQTDNELADRRAQWAGTHQDFVEQLKTETAVKLWENRAELHRARHSNFQWWTMRFGGGGLALLLAWIFLGFELARWLFADDKTAQIASYSAGSIALFTMFVWTMRVMVRSMLSQDHLATDASARSALAHTYLALIKEEAATPEDRAIILATLFAPVSDGLVKDDGMPALSPTGLAAHYLTK